MLTLCLSLDEARSIPINDVFDRMITLAERERKPALNEKVAEFFSKPIFPLHL